VQKSLGQFIVTSIDFVKIFVLSYCVIIFLRYLSLDIKLIQQLLINKVQLLDFI